MKRLFNNVRCVFGTKNIKPIVLTVLIALFCATNAMADIPIGRQWANTIPTIDGVIFIDEWNGAKLTNLPNGNMKTMNDGQYLYVLLDFIPDTVEDAVTNDHYVLAFDIDRNFAVTPNVDLIYDSCSDGQPFVKAFYLSDTTFTGCQSTDPLSQGAYGFSATPYSSTPHRFYEFRLLLSEIGVDPSAWTTSSGEVPRVRLNVGLVSLNPAISSAYPDSQLFPNFTGSLFQLELAIASGFPIGGTGPVFAGVGLVPASYIDGLGYANIDEPTYYTATHAPFGGKLNIFGKWNALRNNFGAAKYRVRYRKDGGPLTTLLQTWTNFRYNPSTTKWVPVAIGPDTGGKYSIPPAGQTWYLNNLLISWQSGLFPEGTYTLKLDLFDAADNLLPNPPGNSLTLFVVNTAPKVTINQVLYEGVPVSACQIVTQGPEPEGFTFDISVTDDRGALDTINLAGLYGVNQSSPVYADSYARHHDEDGPEKWNGVENLIVPRARNPRWRAPTSCAYTFVLSAASRSQNGYGRVFPYVDNHVSLTIETGAGAAGAEVALCGEPPAKKESGGKPAGL